MAWRVFGASAMGSSHRESGLPCQDAFAHVTNGDALVAAVCDGAGSCARSHEGARLVADTVVHGLADRIIGGSLGPATEPGAREALIAEACSQARAALETLAGAEGVDLSVFSSTLVGAVAWPGAGCFFQIGDGYGVARAQTDALPDLVSLPENGEYVNETTFVTGNEWRRHLRLLPFERGIASLVLMSDGAAPFAMAKGYHSLHRPFIDPVERYLNQVGEEVGQTALAATLADPRTDTITNDDKTLLIACWR